MKATTLVLSGETLFLPVFIICMLAMQGCATELPKANPEFQRTIFRKAPGAGQVVFYRSANEGVLYKPISATLYVDREPFVRLKGSEYVQTFLPAGKHEITVVFYRQCESIKHYDRTVWVWPGQELYLKIVPSVGDFTWVYCSPLQGVPLPIPYLGSRVDILAPVPAKAKNELGREVTIDEALEMQFSREIE